jgi:ribonuclease HI
VTRRSSAPPPGTSPLFSDPHSVRPPAGVHTAHIDGASRGNPGPASYAVVLRNPDGKIVLELAKNIGRETNNVAEYYALLAALDFAVTHGISALRIQSDSELLVRQMQGRYKVKSADLKPLHERAQKLSRQLAYFQIEHVRRELNRDADALANVALDGGKSVVSKSNESRGSQAPSPARTREIHFRARIEGGKLIPTEPLNLEEGAEISGTLRIPLKH